MAYQSLYRKYRPQTFADVVGQGHVTRTLQNAITSGRIAHGYLFTGTRGTAKTTVARLLAKALNCESSDRPVAEPCNVCAACIGITAGSSIDVIEMDAASHRGVADIEEVRKSVGYGPMELRYKVFIIDEAHQLSSDAKDAFLKTLEEPPANVVFILATTEPQAIPITIRSRCQQFDFKRGSLSDITGRLRYVLDAEGVAHTPEALNLVARGAEGSYRDSLSLLEQVLAFSPERITAAEVHAVLGTLGAEQLNLVTDAVVRRDAPTLFALAGEMMDAGKEARTILRALIAHFRDLLLVSVGGPAVSAELTQDEVPALQAQARQFPVPQIMQALDVLNEAQSETRWNNQQRFLIERAFLKLLTLGTAPATPITTAPIVFAPIPIAPPPVVLAKPETLIAPPARTPEPVAAKPVVTHPEPKAVVPEPPVPDETAYEIGEEPELPANYFADDDDPGDADAIDEDDLIGDSVGADSEIAVSEIALPTSDAQNGLESDLGDESDEPEDNGPSLFDENDAPDPEPPAPVAAVEIEAWEPEPEPVQVAAPMRPRPMETTPPAPPAPEPNLFTLEDVIKAWPRFVNDAGRISKKTQMMMLQSQPTNVEGVTLEVTFNNRPALDMMSEQKGMDFVRKLLLRCLGVEKLTLRFILAEGAQPAPVRQEKKKVVRDPIAELDRIDENSDGFGGGNHHANGQRNGYSGNGHQSADVLPAPPARTNGAAANSHFAVAPARSQYPAPTPSVAAYDPSSYDEPDEKPEVDDAMAKAAAHPLVQEALSVFGGTIVRD